MKIGVDIVEIKRIEKILDKRRDSFYKRIFTYGEIEYIKAKKHNPKTVAGLFAAKEAVSKLLGTGIGILGWRDIEIDHDKNGKPFINKKAKLEELLKSNGIESIDISIAHERKYAISFAIGY